MSSFWTSFFSMTLIWLEVNFNPHSFNGWRKTLKQELIPQEQAVCRNKGIFFYNFLSLNIVNEAWLMVMSPNLAKGAWFNRLVALKETSFAEEKSVFWNSETPTIRGWREFKWLIRLKAPTCMVAPKKPPAPAFKQSGIIWYCLFLL